MPGPNNAPAPAQPPMPRFTIAIVVDAERHGDSKLSVYAGDVFAGEIAQHLVDLAAKIGSQGYDKRVTSVVEVRAAQHVQAITRDYPAKMIRSGSQALLCVVCTDLYGHMLEGGAGTLIALPPGMPPAPCTFHLDSKRAPCSFDDAVKQLPVQDSDVVIGDPDRVVDAD